MRFNNMCILLLYYANLFYPNEYKKKDKVTLRYFQQILKRLKSKKSIALFVERIISYKNIIYFRKHISYFYYLQ